MIMKGRPMRKVILSMLMAGIAAGAGGCSAFETSAFRSDGIPKQMYLVGGGWDIEYKAYAPGSVYLVEMHSGKLIETKSLDEGDTYRQSIDPGESRLKDMGIEPSAAKFQLYFIPAPGEKPCPEEKAEK
jgi:hypothetical protein